MAVIHCTRKLAQKLSGVSAAPIAETGELGSWHGHLVRFDRVQCVLFCHDDTRYGRGGARVAVARGTGEAESEVAI